MHVETCSSLVPFFLLLGYLFLGDSYNFVYGFSSAFVWEEDS